MPTIKPSYTTGGTFTCTLASKTSGQGRRSAAIDNSTARYLDAEVFVSCTPGTISSPAGFFVYAYGSLDGTSFDTGGSSDADYNTLAGDEKLIGYVAITASSTARGGTFPMGPAWGGILPYYFGIIVSQSNCGTFSGTEGNHVKKWTGIQLTVA